MNHLCKLVLYVLLSYLWFNPARAADTNVPGVSDTTITIGMSSPLSGPNGEYGQIMKAAINAYFDQVNQSGGINGRKLELIALDDGYETERTLANTRTLLNENKVFALLQYYGSTPTTHALNQVFGPAKVPLVGAISGADTLRQPISGIGNNANNRYMFNIRASYADETTAIVNHLIEKKLKNIAVFYQNDGFGLSGLEGIKAALKKHKLEPSVIATVERNSIDVEAAVKVITKAKPEAVIMVTLHEPTVAFIKAMQKNRQQQQFIALSPVGTELLVNELGSDVKGKLARGISISQVMPDPANDTIPMVRDYRQLMQTHKINSYSYYGIEAYVSARVMVEAIKRAGKNPSREKLIQMLEAMSDFDLGGFHVRFSTNDRTGSRFVEMSTINMDGHVQH